MKLSKKAELLICLIYKEYLQRIKDGVSPDRANYYQNSAVIQEEIASKLTKEETASLCWTLFNNGFLNVGPGDNIANYISLTDAGIAYMEGRFERKLEKISKYINLFKIN